MNIEAWKHQHKENKPYCELAHLFPREGGCVIVPLKPRVLLPYFGGHIELPGDHWHHAIGGSTRENDPGNLLLVNAWIHEWLTEHSNAGRVLSCMALRDAGRLEWWLLSLISGKVFPGVLDTDAYIEACQPWPWLDELRTNLLRRAA